MITNRKILCIGDSMLDEFISGKVNRISPEAPVPVLNFENYKQMLGGAANVVSNLSALGVVTNLVSLIGSDTAGDDLLKLVRALESVEENLIISDRKTTVKTRFVAQQNHILRLDKENTHPVDKEIQNKILTKVSEQISKANLLVISDYGKGLLTDAVLAHCIELAKKCRIKVIIDPKGTHWDKYNGASILTPNLKEFNEFIGKKLDSISDLKKYAFQTCRSLNIDCLLITLGEQGVLIADKNIGAKHISANSVEVYDVSGAGDSFIAGFASNFLLSNDIEEATAHGNLVASLAVAKFGTSTVTASEVTETQISKTLTNQIGSIVDLNQAKAIVEQWKARGLRSALQMEYLI